MKKMKTPVMISNIDDMSTIVESTSTTLTIPVEM